MIGRTNARAFAILAVLCAGIAYVGPSAAFDHATFSRAASVSVVSDASGYNALSSAVSWTCAWRTLTDHECQIGLVTNKGAASQSYRIMKEAESAPRLKDWGLGGVPSVSSTSSPWTTWTTPKEVGQTAIIFVNVSACLSGCAGVTYTADLILEGNNTNVWQYNETRIRITMPPLG